MRMRIIDYVEHVGGGRRFFIQLVKALQQTGAVDRIEFVSHGDNLAQVRKAFNDYGIEASFIDIPWEHRFAGPTLPGYRVAPHAIADCDVAWFPWLHHHRLARAAPRVVASFHDGLTFCEPVIASRYADAAAHERETVARWVSSGATIICSSRYWTAELARIYGCPPQRFNLVPISGWHAPDLRNEAVDAGRRPWLSNPFLLCPANTSWHKNHEVLFEGYAAAKIDWPLVLTGPGSDLVNQAPLARRVLRRVAVMVGLRPPHRVGVLRDMASRLGMVPGRTLFPLGYLSDSEYDAVLARAACVVMPTLGEGGGSFPVEEAVLRGIPVLCSDIAVLREQMERLGAEVIWFDPRDPASLAERLRQVTREYDTIRAAAEAQVARLRVRPWAAVAADYLGVFQSVAAARAA